MEAHFVDLATVVPFELAPGAIGRPLVGERMMMNVIDLAPGADVALHSHPHEQIGIVLEGVMTMTIAGETRDVGPKQGFVVPGGVEHGGRAGPGGATVIDVFEPVREDFLERWLAGGGKQPPTA